jgi:hypothetical protein
VDGNVQIVAAIEIYKASFRVHFLFQGHVTQVSAELFGQVTDEESFSCLSLARERACWQSVAS